jgi:transcriptional regulator with XRE-family HTH domain
MGDFQNIFKRLRNSCGLTQAEMAEKIGISRSTIGMYETGAREPDFETLEKIADFFKVDIDYLLGRTDKTTILPETVGQYYLNEETREIAQEVFENPELRSLFHVARDIPPERLKAHIEFMKNLKDQEKGDPDEPC